MPRSMGAPRRKTKRAPCCMGTLLVHMAPPKEVPKKWPKPLFFKWFFMFFGSHSRRHGFEQAPSQTSATLHGSAISPKTYKQALVFQQKRCPQRGHLEAQGWEDKKNGHPKWTPKSPRGIYEKRVFSDCFYKFCSSGSIWWPLPGRPSFSKKAKKHWFYNVSDASPGPNTGLAKEHLGLAEVQNHSKRIGFTIVGSSHEDPFMEGLCSRSYTYVYTCITYKSISYHRMFYSLLYVVRWSYMFLYCFPLLN